MCSLIIIFFYTTNIYAQLEIGIVSGVSTYSLERTNLIDKKKSSSPHMIGLNVGVIADLEILPWLDIQSAVNYTNKGGNANLIKDNINVNYFVLNISPNYNKSFDKITFYVGTGIFIGYALNEFDRDIALQEPFDMPNSTSTESFDYGIIGKFGIEYSTNNRHKIFFQIDYSHSLNNYLTTYLPLDITYVNGEAVFSLAPYDEYKNKSFSFNLGYKTPLY